MCLDSCLWSFMKLCVISKWGIRRAPNRTFNSNEIKSRDILMGKLGCWWGLNGLWKKPPELGFPKNNECTFTLYILTNPTRILAANVSSWKCRFSSCPQDRRKIVQSHPLLPFYSFFSSSTAQANCFWLRNEAFCSMFWTASRVAVRFLG